MTLCSGCWTPNYNKIPLQTSDVPYVLADGDYMDNKGVLHTNQHDVWAMSQADVFDYMKYIRNQSAKTNIIRSNETFWDKIKAFPSKITKNHIIYGMFGIIILFIVGWMIQKRKIKKLQKVIEETRLEDDHA